MSFLEDEPREDGMFHTKMQLVGELGDLEKEIEAFAKRRPHYARKHIWDIATNCQDEGVPFCRKCDDWHHPHQEHTED